VNNLLLRYLTVAVCALWSCNLMGYEILITNGGFETPVVGGKWNNGVFDSLNNTNCFGWTVAAGNIYGGVTATDSSAEGAQHFACNLDPSGTFHTFTLAQKITEYTVSPGLVYGFRFSTMDLYGAGVDFTANLRIGSRIVSTISGVTTNVWLTYGLPAYTAVSGDAGGTLSIEITMSNNRSAQVYPFLDAFHLTTSAVPIQNAGFETPSVGTGTNYGIYDAITYSNFFDWLVTAGNLSGGLAGNETSSEGSQHMYATLLPSGQNFDTFTLAQTLNPSLITAKPGAVYSLSFWVQETNGIDINFTGNLKIGGRTVASISGLTTGTWTQYSTPPYVAAGTDAGAFISIEFSMTNSQAIAGYSRIDGFALQEKVSTTSLIGHLDYSDDFTIPGANNRDNTHDLNWYATNNIDGLLLGPQNGNALTALSGAAGAGFRDAATVSRTGTGNPGATSGVLDFENGSETSFRYDPNRNRFIVQFDVLLAADRTDITVSKSSTATYSAPDSLSLFVRSSGSVDLYNSIKGQMPTGWEIGNQTAWVNIAAVFTKGPGGLNGTGSGGGTIELFVNNQSMGVLDLSGTQFAGLIGSSSIALGTAGTGGVIDNLKVGSDIYPNEGSRRISSSVTLGWSAVVAADSYDVYLGTDYGSVATASTNSAEFLAHVSSNACPVNSLIPFSTYYWRVDAHYTNTTVKDVVHYFVVSPSSPRNAQGSDLIGQVLLADTFTCPATGRDFTHSFAWYSANQSSGLQLESAFGSKSWTSSSPATTYFRNYPTAYGNEGAETGFLEMQNGSLAVAVGTVPASRFVVQFDAVMANSSSTINSADRLEINCGSSSGLTGNSGVLSIFLRRSHPDKGTPIIGLYDSADGEKDTYITTGLTDFEWHNYAAVFDKTAKIVEIYIDQRFIGTLDLTSIYGGLFGNLLSDGYIGIGCKGRALIDNVTMGGYGPLKPNHPSPMDGFGVNTNRSVLSWAPGTAAADGYNVYFGTNFAEVFAANTNSPAFAGKFDNINFNPGLLAKGGQYYWRVDELNGTSATTGNVWKFSVFQDFWSHNIQAPTQLVYVDLMTNSLSLRQQILLTSMQGLVAKKRPEIFLVRDQSDLIYLQYVSSNHGIPYTNADSLRNANETVLDFLLRRYSSYFQGYVLCDLNANQESPLVADSLAGLHGYVVAAPEQQAMMAADGIPEVLDVRNWSSAVLKDCYWDQFSHVGYVGAIPSYTWSLYDWAPAANQAMFWSPDPYFNAQMLDSVVRDSISLGWSSASASWSGEGGFTAQNSAHAVANSGIVTANTSAYAGMASWLPNLPLVQSNRPITYAPEENVHYVAFLDQDNYSALAGPPYRGYTSAPYGDTNRGAIKFNWIGSPLRTKLGPALLQWYYGNATTNDFFVDYFTSEYIQYGYPEFDEYYRQAAQARSNADMRVLVTDQNVPSDPVQRQVWMRQIGAKIAADTNTRGCFGFYGPLDGSIYYINGKPFVNQHYFLSDVSNPPFISPAQLAAAVNAASTNVHNPAAYDFVICGAQSTPWNDYEAAVQAAALFNPNIRVVSMEEMIERIYMNIPDLVGTNGFSVSGVQSTTGFSLNTNQDLILGQTGSLTGPADTNWTTPMIPVLTDGQAPAAPVGGVNFCYIESGDTITYNLGGAANITSIETCTAWNDSGRSAQAYTIDFSNNGMDWLTNCIAVQNQMGPTNYPSDVDVRIAPTASGSSLATGVRYVRFNFPTVQNGGVGYTEIIINGAISNGTGLEIGKSGHVLTLTWHGLGGLYYTSNLSWPVQWTPVTNQPISSNGVSSVILALGTNSSGFYSLRP